MTGKEDKSTPAIAALDRWFPRTCGIDLFGLSGIVYGCCAVFLCVTATGENAMKFILSALGAVALLVGVAASQPADAACYWNGYGWHCWHPHHYGYWHHRHHYWWRY